VGFFVCGMIGRFGTTEVEENGLYHNSINSSYNVVWQGYSDEEKD
jgi:hypothetical protein